jgi:hypothetical protein
MSRGDPAAAMCVSKITSAAVVIGSFLGPISTETRKPQHRRILQDSDAEAL